MGTSRTAFRHHRIVPAIVAMGIVGTLGIALPAPPAAVPPPTSASPAKVAVRDISAELDKIREKHKLPALAGAILTTDGLEALGASGIRVSGRSEKVTPQDQFHLGSCTKAMTATLIAILVEQGKLKWEMTLPEALPSIKDSIHEKYRDVTIADLLTQRSGIPSDMNRDNLWGSLWKNEGPLPEQRDRIAKTMLGWEPDHDKSKFAYANANFIIAGHIAEVATGRSWEDLMKAFIFEPLGMTSAGFGAPGAEGKFDQPQGHRPDASAIGLGAGADNPPSLGPAGTVHASMEDWGKFIALHLRGAKADQKIGDVTIKAETFKKLHTAIKGNGSDYAMGWGVVERPWAKVDGSAGACLTHSGSNTLWFCITWIAPDAGFALLSASNIGGDAGAKGCDEAAAAMIGIHQGK